MICKNCGKEIKDTAKFCGYCGSINEPLSNNQVPLNNEDMNYTPSWMPQEGKSTITPSNGGNNMGYTPSWMTQEVKNPANTVVTSKSVDLRTEIKQNVKLFALPCIYLVWQIIRQFIINPIIFRLDDYNMINVYFYITVVLGCVLFGIAIGGLVISIKQCSKNFKWVYIIPICLIDVYWVVNSLGYMESLISCIFGFSEVFVAIAIAIAMQNTSLGKENTTKSFAIIASVVAGVATLVYPFIYSLLLNLIFGGYSSYGLWNIIIGVASIVGAAIAPAILSKIINNSDSKKA